MHMHMSFYWDTNLGEYLFPGLNINGTLSLVLLCIVLVVLSMIYEATKVHQVYSKARAARERLKNQLCPAGETARLIAASTAGLNSRQLFLRKFGLIGKQMFVFISQNILSYILMLTVMLYNGYVFIAVIIGYGLGYFLFGHISMKVNMENIRARTTHVLCSPTCPTEPSTSRSQNSQNPQQQQQEQYQGYINEAASSSENSSCDTQSTQLAKIEIHSSEPNLNSNITHSCHL